MPWHGKNVGVHIGWNTLTFRLCNPGVFMKRFLHSCLAELNRFPSVSGVEEIPAGRAGWKKLTFVFFQTLRRILEQIQRACLCSLSYNRCMRMRILKI